MKKTLLFIAFVLTFSIISSAQTSIDNLCSEAATKIYRELKRSKIPDGSKIAVLYFEGETASNNNSKTMLGIRLSGRLSQKLIELTNKKEYIISYPINSQEKKYFKVPGTAEEENQFYNNLNDKLSPDYFITGKYYISPDFKTISFSELVLKENVFKHQSTGKSYSFEKSTISINTSEVDELKNLNIEYLENENFMNKILRFSDNNSPNLFEISLQHIVNYDKKDVADNEIIFINESYCLKIEVLKPCYIYAFYYMPDDKEHPYLQPLYPFRDENPKMHNKDIYYLPHSGGFKIEPPTGNAYIKIFACNQPLSLLFTSTKDNNGSFYNTINSRNAEDFFNSLTTAQRNKIPLNSRILNFNIKFQ